MTSVRVVLAFACLFSSCKLDNNMIACWPGGGLSFVVCRQQMGLGFNCVRCYAALHWLCFCICLQIQNNMAKKHEAAQDADRTVIQDKQAVLDGLRAKAMNLFKQIDTDGNGVIDR